MDGNGNFRLTDGIIRTNPVFALSIWARTVWRSDNAGASRRCVAEKLAQWVNAGVCWPEHGVSQFVAAGLLPEQLTLAFQKPCPRIVGLLYDPLHKVGLVNPLVTNVFDDLRNSSLLPFTAEGIRSLLLRLCDSSNQALSGGIPESAGFCFDESLGEHCLGNSMDVAGLLSALDALSGKACPVFSAACAVVEPGLNATLNPVSRIKEKLDAFLREYGSGTLLVTTADCQESQPFHDKFATVWSVNTLGELADEIARIGDVRNELIRSGPLNARQTNAILGQLGYLIDHERSYHAAIHLCDRVQTNGFAADVPQFKRLKLQRQHADALRHSGRFQESLEIVAGMQAMLDGCREALSYEDEARHAVVNATALFDACDFQAAADWLQESLSVCRNAPKSFSAQQRVEVMNTLARAFVMLDQDGWEELFNDSIQLQRIFDPHNVRRTECYLVHALLRAGRLSEAAAEHQAEVLSGAGGRRGAAHHCGGPGRRLGCCHAPDRRRAEGGVGAGTRHCERCDTCRIAGRM